MTFQILSSGLHVLESCDTLILIVPYSLKSTDIINFNAKLSSSKAADFKDLVNTLISKEVFNLYIGVYNADNNRYRTNISDYKDQINREVKILLNTIFKNIHECYKKENHCPAIQGKYFPTLRSITKMVTDSNIFGNSRRDNIKYDARKVDPIYDEVIKAALLGKLNNVALGTIIDNEIDICSDVMSESLAEQAHWDSIVYTFVPPDNAFMICAITDCMI